MTGLSFCYFSLTSRTIQREFRELSMQLLWIRYSRVIRTSSGLL